MPAVLISLVHGAIFLFAFWIIAIGLGLNQKVSRLNATKSPLILLGLLLGLANTILLLWAPHYRLIFHRPYGPWFP